MCLTYRWHCVVFVSTQCCELTDRVVFIQSEMEGTGQLLGRERCGKEERD